MLKNVQAASRRRALVSSLLARPLAAVLERPLSSTRMRLRPATLAPARQLSLQVGRGVWGLMDAVQGKTMIGKDRHGNTYWEVKNPGGNPNPKREIDYIEKQMVSAFAASLLLPFTASLTRLHRLHSQFTGAAGPGRVLLGRNATQYKTTHTACVVCSIVVSS